MIVNPYPTTGLTLKLGKPHKERMFALPDSHVWCGAIAQLPQGGWFMAYSHWPLDYGFAAWVSHSRIGLAVADNMMGPYRPVPSAFAASPHLPPVQHNPVLLQRGDRYYLYFMGNTGPWAGGCPPDTTDIGMHLEDWWTHRNNQRVWIAHTTDPLGDWQVSEQPLFEPEANCLLTTTPFAFVRADGRIQTVVKTVRRNGQLRGGRVEHHTFLSDDPLGPFEKVSSCLLLGLKTEFPLDDHCQFCFGGRYYAIVKDHGEGLTATVPALLLLESEDGFDWQLATDPVVTAFHLEWEDGTVSGYERLEMPRVLFNGGVPCALQLSAWAGGASKSFNLRAPLELGWGPSADVLPNQATP
jgi:hypothetical protein